MLGEYDRRPRIGERDSKAGNICIVVPNGVLGGVLECIRF